jgi:hypothetical protein
MAFKLLLPRDDLWNGEFAVNGKSVSRNNLYVVISVRMWMTGMEKLLIILQKVLAAGSKIVVIGRAEQLSNLGTAHLNLSE